jgi:quinol monooxygenase YgiN
VILIVIKFPVRPDAIDEFRAKADEYAAAVNAEEGSLFFEWSRSVLEPDTFVCIEGFRDGEAGASHVATPHAKAAFDWMSDLVAEQPQIIYVDTPDVSGFGPMGEVQPRR